MEFHDNMDLTNPIHDGIDIVPDDVINIARYAYWISLRQYSRFCSMECFYIPLILQKIFHVKGH